MAQDGRRVALISSGSRGIGAATVRRLAADGWDVSFCYRDDEQGAREVEKSVSELGARVLSVEVDVTDAAQVTAWFRRAQDELGPAEAAVSCAGITRDRPLAQLPEADWRAVIDTGLDGAFHICRAATFAMLKRRSGRIVAVSSVCGVYDHGTGQGAQAQGAQAQGAPGQHATALPGIAGFVADLSSLASRFGISVNAVTPAPVTHDLTAILPETSRADLTETVALRRFGDAAQAADRVAFLLSDAAAGITGRIFEVRSTISLLTPVERFGVPEGAAYRRLVTSERADLEVRPPSGHGRRDPVIRGEPEPKAVVVTGISEQHHHGLAQRVGRAPR
ncbi:MAG TPA: SDR family oxidoreductase [Streptosporangiaceae bacterium]|nr:SDR family oxidoreductase [Streptosporangiaceae bacterium]